MNGTNQWYNQSAEKPKAEAIARELIPPLLRLPHSLLNDDIRAKHGVRRETAAAAIRIAMRREREGADISPEMSAGEQGRVVA